MPGKIGTLFVEYRATADKFLADLKTMAKDAKEFDRTLAPLREQAKNIGTVFSVAGAAITGSLIAAAKVTANFGDKLDEMAEKTGISVQELGRLKYAAEQTDSNFEGLAVGLKFLSRNLFEAATGGKEQTKVFRALGIETKTATGEIRPANEVLTDLSGIFSKLPDGAEKTALAMKLFGKSGQDLIPFLNAGPEGLKKLGDEAERFGVVIDPVTAKLGDEFNKALDRSKTAMLGLTLSIGSVVIPTLTNLINKGNEVVIWAGNVAQQFPNATKAALGLGGALTAIGGSLLGLATLATLAPKVAQGFALIHSVLAPATILLAVRNFGDLAAAITLVGQASLAAKLGLVGLAAGIGIAIGQLINMGIAVSGLQPKIDSWILSMGRSLGINRDIGQTLGNSSKDIKRQEDALAKLGIVVDRGTMSQKQYEDALRKAAFAHFGVGTATKQAASATTDYEKSLRELIASLMKSNTETDKTAQAAERASEKIRDLIAQNGQFLNRHLEDVQEQGRNWVSVMSNAYSKELEVFIKSRETILDITAKNQANLRDMLEKQVDQNNKWIDVMSDDYSKGLGKQIDATEKAIDVIDKAREKASEDFKKAQEKAADDVRQSAGAVFDAMFLKGENVFKSLGNLLKGGALSLGRSIFQDISAALLGPLKMVFDKFIKGLITGPIEALGKAISKRIGTALAEAGTDAAIGKGISVAAGGASAGGGGVLGGVGAGAGSLAGGALSGGIAAAGSIAAAFITKGNLKAIEENSRETRDWLEIMATAWNPLFHKMEFYQAEIWKAIIGGSVISGKGRIGPGAIQPTVSASDFGGNTTINAPITLNLAVHLEGSVTAMEVRDTIAPELTIMLETGVRGVREKWAQIFRDSTSPGTPAPVGI